MIRTILLFLLAFISVNANCQNENLSLQYGKGHHVFSKWKQGSYIKVKTFSNGTFSGILVINDTSSIVLNNSAIHVSDIKRIARFPWVEIGILSAGAVTAVIIHPFFGVTAASIVVLEKLFPNKRTDSKQFRIIPVGTNRQRNVDPIRYAFDSAQFVQNRFTLYRYPVFPFYSARRFSDGDHLSVLTTDGISRSGHIQFVDSNHVSISSDTIDLRNVSKIFHKSINPMRDTLVVSFEKWRLAKKDVRKKYFAFRQEYILNNPPENFLYIGTDIPKLIVPKPNLRIDYYNRYHFGVSASAGWKPFNPLGQGLYFTWRSNVDFCSESIQYKISPFVWFTPQWTRKGIRFGPYYYYKHLDADGVNVANTQGSDITYSLYWHNKTVSGFGIQLGNFHQRVAGFDVQLSLGSNRLVVSDSISHHGETHVRNSDYWTFAGDLSLVYSFRINKHLKRRNRME